jgi:RES domain-containing protein
MDSGTDVSIDSESYIPFDGRAFRHVPVNNPDLVVDTLPAASSGEGRWHRRGEHVLYLAGDQGVAIAEFARHLAADRRIASPRGLAARYIFSVDVGLDAALDLRDARVQRALSLPPDPAWIRDTMITQQIARQLRSDTEVQAIIVPSMAFLDDPERWNIVVFRVKLPSYPKPYLTNIRQVGTIRPSELLGIIDSERE